MHGPLLRLALVLYSVGLLHSVLTVLRKKQTLFAPAVVAAIAGFICHATSIVLRAYDPQTVAASQPYETTFSLFAAVAVLAFLLVYWRYKIASLGFFAFPAIFVMTFLANLAYDSSGAAPKTAEQLTIAREMLRSRWIYIHIPLVVLGYVAFFVAFSAAVLYLIQERELKLKRVFHNRLPSLEICDDLAYRSLAIGFPLMTLAFLSGALWAQQLDGVTWISDPMILVSFLTWLIYLTLIHYRFIAGWQGKKAAYLAIVGFVGVVVTFSVSGLSTFHP
jgi:ABC-type transport system involved in cytochrome c biogenesis permease subunit